MERKEALLSPGARSLYAKIPASSESRGAQTVAPRSSRRKGCVRRLQFFFFPLILSPGGALYVALGSIGDF